MAAVIEGCGGASRLCDRRRSWASILAIVLPAVLVMGAAPSFGHSDLASATPDQGARLESPPTEIGLRFTEDISTQFAQVSLTRDTGSPQRLPITVRGPLLTASVPRPTGESSGGLVPWTVAYRVVSADGHPITGAVEFTAPASAAVPPTATATPSAPSPTARPGETDKGVPPPQTRATGAENDADGEPGTSSRWMVLGILVAAGLLATATLGFFAARRRRGSPP